ncbi:hypothetical protein [Pseudophaeobacter sp. 1A09344]|uniref:hypothetical protein n=1 Tax=Pseudophaeobacter sp. 1A09344 TaxID=3098144 RepID=UPI0034D47988
MTPPTTDTSREAVEAIAAEFDYRVEMHSKLSTGPAGGLRTERGMEAAKTHSATAAVLRALLAERDAALLREKTLKDNTEELRQLRRVFNAVKSERDALRDQLAAARNEVLEEAKAECEAQRVKCNDNGQFEAAAFCKNLLVYIDALKSTTNAAREVTVQEAAKAVTFEEWLEACPDDDTETNRDRARRVLGPRYGPWLREAWRLGMAQVEASDYYKTGALCALAKEEQSDE